MDSDYPRGPHPQDTRTYLQELIKDDPYNLSVAEIDAFADTLAARFPERDPMHRGMAHMLLITYMDAWLVGYEAGWDNGIDEGKDIIRLGLLDTLPGVAVMRVVTFGAGSVTLELDPADCLMLGAACAAAIKNDAIPNLVLCEALQSVMALGAAVGAATSHMHDDEPFTPKAISDTWMPVDDRYVH